MLLYRLVFLMVLPVLGLRMVFALISGKETLRGLAQRFGFGPKPPLSARTLWVHGASLGELTAARELIYDLLAKDGDLHILVSANTYSGRDMVATWGEAQITSILAPLDGHTIVRRFLKRWKPIAMISLENEIWPARILTAARQNIPVLVVAARMSDKSSAIWARFPGFSARVMGSIDAVFPMDSKNGKRFSNLGLPTARLCPPVNLKTGVVLARPDTAELARFQQIYTHSQTILAASTHSGEEVMVLEAFAKASRLAPKLRLILAPRHAVRSTEVTALIQKSQLTFSTRSSGDLPGPDTQVYLADTTGEMPLWYTLSGRTFLGGSLTEKGGHSPVEPVQFGSLVIHGPSIENHLQAYRALHRSEACIPLAGPHELTTYFSEQMNTVAPDPRAKLAQAALSELHKSGSPTDIVIKKLGKLSTAV